MTDGGMQVAVTGAAGFLGSHVVKLLLERGYRVRAVVRDAANDAHVGFLKSLVPEAADALTLCSADLMQPNSHDEAFAGCRFVHHMATAVRLSAKDPQRDIVDVAVRGTQNVLASARRVETTERVVLTSSIAAVLDDAKPRAHVFTEKDWNDSATLNTAPYPLAKVLSERAAWDAQPSNGATRDIDVVAVNPSFVFGPLHHRRHIRTSPAFVRDLLVRKLPACPQLFFNIVDVRDVAEAHVAAMAKPEAHGRYILSNCGLWMHEVARMVARRFPDRPVSTRRLPNFLTYAAALFDKRANFAYLRRNLGRSYRIDNRRSIDELDLTYRPIEETVAETCQSLIDLGTLPVS